MSETLGGEYISATGPISLWEKMFNTEFYVFHHIRSTALPASHSTGSVYEDDIHKVVRAERYSVPIELNEHVSHVFHTVQMPMAIRSGPIAKPVIPGDSSGSDQNKTNIRMNASPSGYITPSLLASNYNIGTAKGSLLSTQSVFETLTQYYSPADLLKFQNTFGVSTAGEVINIGAHSSDSQCINTPDNCLEGNLDIQYLMAIAQISPTTYWWIDKSNSFATWLQMVANMQSPPLVFSIRFTSTMYLFIVTLYDSLLCMSMTNHPPSSFIPL